MNPTERSRVFQRSRHLREEGVWQCHRDEDHVAIEEPLEIRVEGKPIAVVMRTPGHDEELAAGFLLTEGVVAKGSDIFELSQCPSTSASRAPDERGEVAIRTDADEGPAISGNAIDVILTDPAAGARLDGLTRHVFSSSSCGICGKATIDSIVTAFPKVGTRITVDPDLLASLPGRLRSGQSTFDLTGGLHACGIFDSGDGELLVLREDVGRHNAVDKALGRLLLKNQLPATGSILLVSGRISFEIMQKALAAGVPMVAGISAPTSLAVEFARQSGQQLIAFLRDQRYNSYTDEP